jgi:transcriptional regulator with XRE-family HTH domain
MDIKVRFGLKVKELRKAKKISQEELAHLAQLERSYVSNIEMGKRNVSLEVMEKLAGALGVEMGELVNF